ncbi:MAG TPA: aspartyl protease family protein [Rhizomicrobium sp.]|nr:aspartyl protease family protein [Rhizomicrobium sp.]
MAAVPPVSGQYIIMRRRVVVVQPMKKQNHGGGWLIACGLVAAFVVVGKLAGNGSHALPAAPAGRQVVIEADAYDQCYLDAFANGAKFHFLLDSGAAGVFFSIRDARKLGFNPAKLTMDHTYQGWGWRASGATVRLQSLEVAGLTFDNVEAAIDQLGSVSDQTPLLGAPILKALNFQVRKGSCSLTVPQ